MKRYFLTLLFSFLIYISGFSQSTYYDALYLNKFIKSKTFDYENVESVKEKELKVKLNIVSSRDELEKIRTELNNLKKLREDSVFTIFIKYGIMKDINDAASIQNNLLNNPFLKDLTFTGVTHGLTTHSLITSISNNIGGLDITNIADGFAKFLVKRTKEELNVAFFSKFKEELSKPEFKDLQTVFPQTYRALNAIGDEIYNYEAYIQTLRECFEKDLSNLITNLPSVIDNHPQFFDKQPELKAILRSAFYIGQQIQDKKHPGEIIENYPDSIWAKSNPNYQASFQTLKLISTSLRNNRPNKEYWISKEELKILYDDDIVFQIYMGLIYQQAKNQNIKFRVNDNDITLQKILYEGAKTINVDLPQYKNFVNNFILKAIVVDNKLSDLKKTGTDSLLLENYYSFFSSCIDLFKYSIKVEELPHVKDLQLNLKDKTQLYVDVVQTSSELAIDINRRNYSAAVINAYHLLSLAFPEDSVQYLLIDLKDKLNAIQNNYKGDVDNLAKKQKELINESDWRKRKILSTEINRLNLQLEPYLVLKTEVNRLEKISTFLNYFYKYGTFTATIVQAKSSDEVAKAIEAFALPSGSSRIKRETPFNVSLNGYVGLFGGHEYIKGGDNSSTINVFGVTAPIGVAISFGKSKLFFMPCKKSGHWSHTFFVSVVDLGAIASFRFTDSTTTQVPNIQLKDIIAPGFFYSLGIPKSPLSLNLGCQIGPTLRKVGTTQNEYEDNLSWRLSASLCVDIPILNFYSKSK